MEIRTAEYTPDEVDSILMSRIKQAEKINYKDKITDNGDLAIKRNTRAKTRVNYTEDILDIARVKTVSSPFRLFV